MTSDQQLRVALADRSPLFREGLALVLERGGIDVPFQAATARELLTMRGVLPDVAVVEATSEEDLAPALDLGNLHPEIGILVLDSTGLAAELAHLFFRSHDRPGGYLIKSTLTGDDLCDAVRRVADRQMVVDPAIVDHLLRRRIEPGHPGSLLSEREQDVLRRLAAGRSNAGIASDLHMSSRTVETYVRHIFLKLDLPDDTYENRRVLATLAWLAEHPQTLRPPRPVRPGGPGRPAGPAGGSGIRTPQPGRPGGPGVQPPPAGPVNRSPLRSAG